MTIRKSIKVERSPEVSFRIFCEEMSQWWPGGFGKETKAFIEKRVGSRYFERSPDGAESEIGRVTAYQPPALVAFTFRAPSWDFPTQVEVRFIAEGAGTRVELEHSGWEQDAKLTAGRKNYDSGWDMVLGHYQAHAGSVTL
ncbi:MAG TPA: SRPBCC domain-containing protein [Candidatus Binataceae bacterium]|nr:SRPBCC domain-containing protein [Candidatus Binataceae bacterium]